MEHKNKETQNNKRSLVIFFLCNDPERALGLENVFESFHIVCIDDNLIIDEMLRRRIKVFSLERELKKNNPIFRNSNKLLQHELVQKYIVENTPKGETPNVMFFKIAANIENTCKKLGYNILNTSAYLNKKYELKLSQYEELKDDDLNFPKTQIVTLGEISYKGLALELGENFVIQYDRGHTGTGTVFISSEAEFNAEKEKFPKRQARISKKIDGEAWTINACATRFGVAYGGLSYQITGIPELTDQEGGTVGNDWTLSSRLSSESIRQISKITENVGKRMFDGGFRGMFGLDFVIDKGGVVYLIEVNARQTASVSIHTKLMLKAKQIPLQVLHIAEFLFERDGDYLNFISMYFPDADFSDFANFIRQQNQDAIKSINASQIIARNTSGKTALIEGVFEPGEFIWGGDTHRSWINKALNPKVYYLDEEGYKTLLRKRPAYSIQDINGQEGFIIFATGKGHQVSPGNEMFRIQAPFSLLDEEGNLKHWVRAIVSKVKDLLV